MKRFLTFYQKDKEVFKMINQTETGFELVVLSEDRLNEFLHIIKNSGSVCIVWQMKFKPENFILYNDCKFSEPMENILPKRLIPSDKAGKKIKVECKSTSYYSNSYLYKDSFVNRTRNNKHPVYKDGKLLDRMLKINNLSLK